MNDRTRAFGQDKEPSLLDRVGRNLSTRRLRRLIGCVEGRRCADIGCGFDAALSVSLFGGAAQVTLVDVAVDPLAASPGTHRIVEGHLPEVLDSIPDKSFDVIICNNVLEHLWEPEITLRQFHRLLATSGVCELNVPSWTGKRALEFAAFRLRVAPASEMNDHKAYYNPKDLWLLLVRSGFRPQDIKVRRHKLTLNTVARVRS